MMMMMMMPIGRLKLARDSDTTFKVKRSKINLQGAGHIVAVSRTACYLLLLLLLLNSHVPFFHRSTSNGRNQRATIYRLTCVWAVPLKLVSGASGERCVASL